ncbi:hypothetical protein LTR37_017839 [Vermiconidia calcicola]|uniref:Uncharacterized protein n=1 Tax=Vermiconidia calcicola TaxID=1690605 RepID=A0ACC3MJW7_9PEZI|nr:hypothetical protein LTR37_017839 [Vermiconidia calcicola]
MPRRWMQKPTHSLNEAELDTLAETDAGIESEYSLPEGATSKPQPMQDTAGSNHAVVHGPSACVIGHESPLTVIVVEVLSGSSNVMLQPIMVVIGHVVVQDSVVREALAG